MKDTLSLGLDLSLTGTGVILLKNGKIVGQKCIKSKPVGDKPLDELKRIMKIVEDIEMCLTAWTVDIAVIENMAFGVRNATSLTQLAGLNYFVRAMLWSRGTKFVLVAPTTLKKFITGSGASKKDVMLMETYKRYKVTILNDNENDAFGLAKIGEILLKPGALPTFQQEVIKLLRKQL